MCVDRDFCDLRGKTTANLVCLTTVPCAVLSGKETHVHENIILRTQCQVFIPVPTYTGPDGVPGPAWVWAVTVMQYRTEPSSRPGTETD